MSNGPEFFRTQMGHRFYESTMPRLVAALEKLANPLMVVKGGEEVPYWKECMCGRKFTKDQWKKLPLVGYFVAVDEDDKPFGAELRNCPCRSTISIRALPARTKTEQELVLKAIAGLREDSEGVLALEALLRA